MPICSKCYKNKPELDFDISDRTGKLYKTCRECQNKYKRANVQEVFDAIARSVTEVETTTLSTDRNCTYFQYTIIVFKFPTISYAFLLERDQTTGEICDFAVKTTKYPNKVVEKFKQQHNLRHQIQSRVILNGSYLRGFFEGVFYNQEKGSLFKQFTQVLSIICGTQCYDSSSKPSSYFKDF